VSDDVWVDEWRRPLLVPDEPSAARPDPDITVLAEAAADPEPVGIDDADSAATTEPPAGDPRLGLLIERVTEMEAGIAEFHRRSAHREGIIDRLHEENQTLRGGIGRAILEPVVTDLVRLYDAISREIRRAGETGEFAGVLQSFADQVELTLERCGVEIVVVEPGEPFRSGTHAAAAVVPTADLALQDTAVELLSVGLRDQETGRMRRPVRARFHRYVPAEGSETPADRSEDDQ
jgi:molecular chaperone GrpE